jgi:hypothetical protein
VQLLAHHRILECALPRLFIWRVLAQQARQPRTSDERFKRLWTGKTSCRRTSAGKPFPSWNSAQKRARLSAQTRCLSGWMLLLNDQETSRFTGAALTELVPPRDKDGATSHTGIKRENSPPPTRYREEMNCQITKDSIHRRHGWTLSYLIETGASQPASARLPLLVRGRENQLF